MAAVGITAQWLRLVLARSRLSYLPVGATPVTPTFHHQFPLFQPSVIGVRPVSPKLVSVSPKVTSNGPKVSQTDICIHRHEGRGSAQGESATQDLPLGNVSEGQKVGCDPRLNTKLDGDVKHESVRTALLVLHFVENI